MLPALALNNTNGTDLSVPIVKTLTKKADAPVPNTPITFSVEPATAQAIAQSGTSTIGGYTVFPGVGNEKVFESTCQIPAPDEAVRTIDAFGKTSYTYPALDLKPKIEAGADVSSIFSKAGIYRYVVKEVEPAFAGLSQANPDTYYYIDVFVENDSTASAPKLQMKEILAWSINSQTGQNQAESDFKTASFPFANEYKTQSVTVNKTITGNTADLNDTFRFQISITADHAADVFSLTDAQNQTIFLSAGTDPVTAEVELGQNQSFSIGGLSADDSYTIQETNPGAYQVQINPNDDTSVTIDTQSSRVSGTAGNADHKIGFINTRTGNVPTGFFVTYGPYLIGLAAFGALGYAMFHKKKAR